MSQNMSHCRFENTAQALEECLEAIERKGSLVEIMKTLSEYEREGLRSLLKSAEQLLQELGDDELAEEFIEANLSDD